MARNPDNQQFDDTLDVDRFRFTVHTLKNVYQPINLERSEEKGAIAFSSRDFVCGTGKIEGKGSFTVRFWHEDSELCWRVKVEFFETVKGVKTSLPPLAHGKIICSDGKARKLSNGEKFGSEYPFVRGGGTGWTAINFSSSPFQVFMVNYKKDVHWSLRLSAVPPRVSRFAVLSEEDSFTTTVYTEELATDISPVYESPTIYFEPGAPWRKIAARVKKGLDNDFAVPSRDGRADVPEWMRQTALVAHLDGLGYFEETNHTFAQMANRVGELAGLFDPEKILLQVTGWSGRGEFFDYPDYEVAESLGGKEGFARFVDKAHDLGIKVMPTINMQAIGAERLDDYRQFEAHLVQDSSGMPAAFRGDWDGDGVCETILHYVSLDCAAWREHLLDTIDGLVGSYSIDAIFLDQTCCFWNDPRHDHYRGFRALTAQIRAAFPQLLLAGEGLARDFVLNDLPLICESDYPMYEPAGARSPVFDELCQEYVFRYLHPIVALSPDGRGGSFPHDVSMAPVSEKSDKRFKRSLTSWPWRRGGAYDAECFDRGLIPTLVIANWNDDLHSDAVGKVLSLAERYRAGQKWVKSKGGQEMFEESLDSDQRVTTEVG
jgi:hypothetical protein